MMMMAAAVAFLSHYLFVFFVPSSLSFSLSIFHTFSLYSS